MNQFQLRLANILVLVLICFLSGCHAEARSKSPPPGAPSTSQSTLQSGYRLLYDLLGDEKNVSKLLLIKHERPELGTLIKEISATCANAYKQLDAFVKADSSLDVKTEVLPVAERQTREKISKDRGKELLKAKGKNLEVNLLLTQAEALAYGSHLADVLAEAEPQAARQQFLVRLATELDQLHAKVTEMFLAHYS